MRENNKALPYVSLKKQAKVDLFCLHYAGGSSAVFRDWDNLFPDWIAIRPVELPGRGSRILEQPLSDIKTLITNLEDAIKDEITRPWALFGHSLGAALGYKICQNLQKTLPALAFFPSGRHAPTLHDPAPKRGALSDDKLIEEVRSLGGSPEEVLQNKELMDLLLPMIRSDFILSETIQKTDSLLSLDCYVHVFAGSHDAEVPIKTLSQWQDSCSKEISIDILEGNHFFLHENSSIIHIRNAICQLIKPLLTSPTDIKENIVKEENDE